VVLGFYHLGFIGGGDAQIWIPIVVFSNDYVFSVILLVLMVVFGFIVMFRQRGFVGALKRASYVAKNLGRSREDTEAVKMPWSIVAALAWSAYVLYVLFLQVA